MIVMNRSAMPLKEEECIEMEKKTEKHCFYFVQFLSCSCCYLSSLLQRITELTRKLFQISQQHIAITNGCASSVFSNLLSTLKQEPTASNIWILPLGRKNWFFFKFLCFVVFCIGWIVPNTCYRICLDLDKYGAQIEQHVLQYPDCAKHLVWLYWSWNFKFASSIA